MSSNIFDEYQKGYQDEYDGDVSKGVSDLHDEAGGDRKYFDCEMRAFLSVERAIEKKSENPEHQGEPVFAATFRIEEMDWQEQPEDGRSKLSEGTTVSWTKYLPRSAKPSEQPLGKKMALSEVVRCVAAIYGLREDEVDFEDISSAVQDDGELIQGWKVGVVTEANFNEEQDRYYYNPDFFPVDETDEGYQEVRPLTAEKWQQKYT